jgi:arsenite methyltransferase
MDKPAGGRHAEENAMATRPIDLDVDYLRDRVRATYDRVARAPGSGFHFRTGMDYAIEVLRYPREDLETLPAECTAPFSGVGNPHRITPIPTGATVLDHACGAGMDVLLAARRVGPEGRAIGVDMTPAMRECAARAAREAGLEAIVDIRDGTFEDLPVENDSIDYVISNGVLNLAPDKPRVVEEIARVLKPGGELLLADVVVSRPLAPSARRNADLWAACVAGAVTAPELTALTSAAGLAGGRLVEHFECFKGTALERKLGPDLIVRGVTFFARKPASAPRNRLA